MRSLNPNAKIFLHIWDSTWNRGPSYFTKRKFIFENEKSSMGEVRKGQLRKTTANIIFFSQVQNIFDGFSKKNASTLHILNK